MGSLCWGFTGAPGAGHRGLFPRWGWWGWPAPRPCVCMLISKVARTRDSLCRLWSSDERRRCSRGAVGGGGEHPDGCRGGGQATGHKHRAAPLNPLAGFPTCSCTPHRRRHAPGLPPLGFTHSCSVRIEDPLNPPASLSPDYLRRRFQGGARQPRGSLL